MGTSYSVTSLAAYTSYDWRVTTNCSLNTSTATTAAFTTLAAPCSAATGLSAGTVTGSSAILSWTAVSGALSYQLEYKSSSTGVWTVINAAYTGTSYTLAGLSANTSYDWRVTTNCPGNTAASTQGNFTTLNVVCNSPASLTSSAISSSGATISWGAATGAASYRVEYKLTSATTWTVAASATTALTANLTALIAASSYYWRVMTNCSTTTSLYSSASFTTLAAAACPGTLDTSTNGTTAGAAIIPFNTDVKGMINPKADIDYYKFVLVNGGSVTITLTTLPANFDLQLFKGTTQVASSAKTGTTSESIVYTAAAATYYVRVNAGSTISNASSCYTLKVATAVGTFEAPIGSVMTIGEDYSVKVSPNPVRDRLMVNLAGLQGQVNAVIYNTQGQIMKRQQSYDGSYSIDVSTLPQGVYLIKMTNGFGKHLHSSKFIKQ